MPYIFCYFRTIAEKLHLSYSQDGIQWTALNGNKPTLACNVSNKSIRDPYIRQDPAGKFHLIFTDSWHSRNIIYTSSDDLIHWEEQHILPVMKEFLAVHNTWAPEFVYNPSEKLFYIFWSSTTNNVENLEKKKSIYPGYYQRIWYCTTPDFKTLSPSQILFDPGYSIIDATMIQFEGKWYMVFKDERGKNIPTTPYKALKVAQASSPAGPWNIITSDYINPHLTEGPCLFKNKDEIWLLYDHFMNGKYGGQKSSDMIHWEPITNTISFPEGPRHGTVFTISEEILQNLQQTRFSYIEPDKKTSFFHRIFKN